PLEGPLPDHVPDCRPTSPYEDELGVLEENREFVRAVLTRLTPRERRAFIVYWQSRGDRMEALDSLGLTGKAKEMCYKDYDGPLYHAKKKMAVGLGPVREGLENAGADRVWDLVHEELCGSPGAAL